MFEILNSYISKTSAYIELLPIFVGLWRYKYLNINFRIIFYLALITVLPHGMKEIYGISSHKRDLYYNIYIIVETLLLYLFFWRELKGRSHRLILNLSIGISFLVGLYMFFKFPFATHFYNEWVCINNIFYTGWVLLLLLQIYSDDLPFDISRPIFWILVGLFMYTSTTSVVFSLWKFSLNPAHSSLKNLMVVNNFFNIVMYVFWAYAFYLCKPVKSINIG